jgi:hypothetical protein
VLEWWEWLIVIPILGLLLVLGGALFVLAAMFISRLLGLVINFALYGTLESPHAKGGTDVHKQ